LSTILILKFKNYAPFLFKHKKVAMDNILLEKIISLNQRRGKITKILQKKRSITQRSN